MSILELQLEWYLPLIAAALVGLLSALGFALSEALKPRFKKDENGKFVLNENKEKIIIEKAGLVTKDEWTEIGSLILKGASYGVMVAVIIMILQLTPLQTSFYLAWIFGDPLSVQYTAVTCGLIIIMIGLGLHVKAWMEGGILAVITASVVEKAKEVGASVGASLEEVGKAAVDLGATKTDEITDQVTESVDQVADQMKEEANKIKQEFEAKKAEEEAALAEKQKEIEELEKQLQQVEDESTEKQEDDLEISG